MRFICYQMINGAWSPSLEYRPPIKSIIDDLTAPELGIVTAWIDTAQHGEIMRAGFDKVLIAVDENLFNAAMENSRLNDHPPADVAEAIEPIEAPDIPPPPVVTGGGHAGEDRADKLTRVNNAEPLPSGGLFG